MSEGGGKGERGTEVVEVGAGLEVDEEEVKRCKGWMEGVKEHSLRASSSCALRALSRRTSTSYHIQNHNQSH